MCVQYFNSKSLLMKSACTQVNREQVKSVFFSIRSLFDHLGSPRKLLALRIDDRIISWSLRLLSSAPQSDGGTDSMNINPGTQ